MTGAQQNERNPVMPDVVCKLDCRGVFIGYSLVRDESAYSDRQVRFLVGIVAQRVAIRASDPLIKSRQNQMVAQEPFRRTSARGPIDRA